jgi:RPA family protein
MDQLNYIKERFSTAGEITGEDAVWLIQEIEGLREERGYWYDTIKNDLNKIHRYQTALEKIATRKMSAYLSTSHMNQDFIKTAIDALEESEYEGC